MRKDEEAVREEEIGGSETKKTRVYGSDNFTIIRIWRTRVELKGVLRGIEFEPGHVSLETKHGYISLWPTYQGKSSSPIPALYHPVESQFKDYFQDFKAENDSEPDYQVRLFSLNVDEMNKRFEEVKSKMKGWTLFGSHALLNRNKAESCASLAWKLLKSGGIYNCIPSTHSSYHSVVNVPTLLLDSVVTARMHEIDSLHIDTPICDEDENVKKYSESDEGVKSNCVLS